VPEMVSATGSEVACQVNRDFIRHIANKVFAEAVEKIPSNIVAELRKRLGRLEDKYDFSIFGGRPEKLADALSSPDWRDLVDFAEKMNMTWVIRVILERALEAYKDCPMVYDKIREELAKLSESKSERSEEISLQSICRSLKYRGYKCEIHDDKIILEEPNIRVSISISNGNMAYEICRHGKTTSLDSILIRVEKLREF
jgi:hypothetical protein